MSTTSAVPRDLELSDTDRDAMTRDLFAIWNTLRPDAHHCFAGCDAELVKALTQARAEIARAHQHRERGSRAEPGEPGEPGEHGEREDEDEERQR